MRRDASHARNTMPYPHHTNVTAHSFHVTSCHILPIPRTSKFNTLISHRHHIIFSSHDIQIAPTLGSQHVHHTDITPTSRCFNLLVSYHSQITPISHITLTSHHVTPFPYETTPYPVHIIPITDISRTYHTYVTSHHFRITSYSHHAILHRPRVA